ncbi:MAG: tRNA (cytidine(34)-2'-O)-methyltransferase [Pirellulaceae bacterium]|nr:tRNA (cytidine(34)-2'-O)-methyltransferase [Pirellulaceae bacterium]
MNRNDGPNKENAVKDQPIDDTTVSSSQDIPLSSSEGSPQPSPHDPNRSAQSPSAHVVLYQPEIPQNTGNIGRTCVATGAKLWIVRPAGFQLDESRLRRAGLDYWQHLQLGDANHWQHLTEQLRPQFDRQRVFYLSRFATREIWDVDLCLGDVFVFGSESGGLPDQILQRDSPCALRLPVSQHVRSLNLATTAGIVLYEHQRQIRHCAK